MNISLICFSDSGSKLALKLCSLLELPLASVHSTERFAQRYGFTAHKRVCDEVGELFSSSDALIFICACGIAVRDIAPYLKSKTTDPAVLVLDDRGQFVIPILSGHIGGANALAKKIAGLLGSTPVITTATDCAGLFSCDTWASEKGCAISSMQTAKEVSAAILEGGVPVCSELPLPETLPNGLVHSSAGLLGIFIGIHNRNPYSKTLRLIPRVVSLGIGCRRGESAERIRETVFEALEENEIDFRSVCSIASIDVKRDEEGLLEFARGLKVPLSFYSAEELESVEGDFTESEFVRKTVGVGNVCERAAVLGGGELIIRKAAKNGVTVSAAEREWRVEF